MELARQKECEIHEGHCMSDYVHMMISIPPSMLYPKFRPPEVERTEVSPIFGPQNINNPLF